MRIITGHRLDNIFTTIIIILFLKFLTFFYNIDWLDPVQNFIQNLELADVYFSNIQDRQAVPKDTNIVLVNFGYLNRKQIAAEVNILNRFEPKVIGIDSYFFRRKTQELDSLLVDAFSKVKNLVLVSKLTGYDEENDKFDSLLTSNEIFNRYAKTGYANFHTVKTEIKTTRLTRPIVSVANKEEYLFAVKISQIYNPQAADNFLKRNNTFEIINYRRNLDKYSVLDVKDVFTKSDSLQFLKDKIVIIGFLGPDTSSAVSQDIFFTPMNEQYLGKAYPDMYGVVVQANVVSMILEEKYIGSMPKWFSNALIILSIYLLMSIFTWLRNRFEEWYEAVGLIVLIGMLILMFFITLYSLKWFLYNIELKDMVFVLIVAEIVSESYHGSLKPLTISFYKKIRKSLDRRKKIDIEPIDNEAETKS